MLHWMRVHLRAEEYLLWRDQMEMPPEGVEPEAGTWSDEEMMRQFRSFKES